jgi:isopenicillin-N epimerase
LAENGYQSITSLNKVWKFEPNSDSVEYVHKQTHLMDAQPPKPLRENLAAEWSLKEHVAFLNHGSFGSVPRYVMAVKDEWRRKIEAEPLEILSRRSPELIEEIKAPIGAFLGMKAPDFGFVTNATEGVNAVLRSRTFRPGDELLTTTHVYNAVRQCMKYLAGRTGASYRELEVPLPVRSSEQIAQTILQAIKPNTRILVLDHATSPTGLIFPVERIVAECAKQGIDVLVDGAHVPGMLPLDVEKIGAAYYTGNLHKWICAPKGSGFLWVRPDKQAEIHPCIISHHLDLGFVREFGWQGTRDISNWLSVPRAIEFLGRLGWKKVQEHNHAMAVWAHQMLSERLGVEPISPLDGSLIGSMATMYLPRPFQNMSENTWMEMQQRLYTDHQVEAPLILWSGQYFVRVCGQLYNEPSDYERLADAIPKLAASL